MLDKIYILKQVSTDSSKIKATVPVVVTGVDQRVAVTLSYQPAMLSLKGAFRVTN